MFAFPINLIVEVIKLYQLDKLLVVPFLMLKCTALGFVLRWFIAPPSFNLVLFSSNDFLFYVFFAYLFNFELKGKLAIMLDNDFVFELLVLFGHLIWVNWGIWILNDCCFLLGFFLCFSLLLFLLFLDLLFD